MRPVPRTADKAGQFRESIAGALAYVTFIPAILFLMLEPYKKNVFVRFHSVQCLLFWVATAAAVAAIRLAALLLFMIPVAGPLLAVLVWTVGILAAGVIWLVLIVKALQGQRFKLPILGDWAERHANSAAGS